MTPNVGVLLIVYSQTIMRHALYVVVGLCRRILEHVLPLIKAKPFFHTVKIKRIYIYIHALFTQTGVQPNREVCGSLYFLLGFKEDSILIFFQPPYLRL